MNYLLFLINVVMMVLGQVIWKAAVSKMRFELSAKAVVNVFTNPYIILGGVIYVFATVIWIYLLSKAELSKIYPLQSICYVVGALAGVIFFKENLTLGKGIGIMLILCGAYLIAIK